MNQKAIELENRLVKFSVINTIIAEYLTKTKTGNHLKDQLVRSCVSPALNYGEAQVAESTPDFIHKLRICLKELKETLACLKIIQEKELAADMKDLSDSIDECGQLISIFVKSVETATKNFNKKNQANGTDK